MHFEKNLFGCNMRTDRRKASEASGEPSERTVARERSGNGGKEKQTKIKSSEGVLMVWGWRERLLGVRFVQSDG